MKLYKWVSYASLAVLALTLLLIASLPGMFRDASIAWRPVMIFLGPALALIVLLFAAPHLPARAFLFITILSATAAAWLTVATWMPPLIFGIFLAACCALVIGTRALRPDVRCVCMRSTPNE